MRAPKIRFQHMLHPTIQDPHIGDPNIRDPNNRAPNPAHSTSLNPTIALARSPSDLDLRTSVAPPIRVL